MSNSVNWSTRVHHFSIPGTFVFYDDTYLELVAPRFDAIFKRFNVSVLSLILARRALIFRLDLTMLISYLVLVSSIGCCSAHGFLVCGYPIDFASKKETPLTDVRQVLKRQQDRYGYPGFVMIETNSSRSENDDGIHTLAKARGFEIRRQLTALGVSSRKIVNVFVVQASDFKPNNFIQFCFVGDCVCPDAKVVGDGRIIMDPVSLKANGEVQFDSKQ